MRNLSPYDYAYLQSIYKEVMQDKKSFPEKIGDKNHAKIETTEDFFTWRDHIKTDNKENSKLRNEIVENTISGNSTLELLYDWSKFYRMLDFSRARLMTIKEELSRREIYDEEVLHSVHVSTEMPLIRYLMKKGKDHTDRLFFMKEIGGFGYRYNEFRTFNSPYEFTKIITHEEEYGPLSIDILICYLRAYGVERKDLLLCGKEIYNETKKLIESLENGSYIPKEQEIQKRRK